MMGMFNREIRNAFLRDSSISWLSIRILLLIFLFLWSAWGCLATAQGSPDGDSHPDSLLKQAEIIACTDSAKALAFVREVLKDARRQGDSLHEARAYWKMGYVYELVQLPNEALAWFERALTGFENLQDELGIASSHFHIGYCLHRAPVPRELKDFSAAEEHYRRSAELYERHHEHMSLAQCLFYLAASVQNQDRFREAVSIYRRCVVHADSAGNQNIKASALTNIGALYHHFGDTDASLQCFREAIPAAESVGDLQRLSLAYNNIGSILASSGRLVEAEEALRKALKIAEQLGDPVLTAQALSNIAGNLSDQGKYEKSLEAYEKGLALIEPLTKNNPYIHAGWRAEWHRMIGLNARSLRQYTKAFRHFRTAAELFDGDGNRSGQAFVLRDIGWAYYELDQWDKARTALSSALATFRELNMPAEIARGLLNLAPVLVKEDSSEAAQHMIEEALAISTRLKMASETAAARQELGRLHFNAGRYEEADPLLSAAVNARRSLRQNSELSTALVWLAECRHAQGKGADIEALLMEAEILAASVGLQQNLLVIANLRAEHAATMGRYGDAHVFWKKYKLLKDSVTSVAQDARFQSLLVEFDAERKDFDIAQLTSERAVQRLEMERQNEALRMRQLEARQHVQEIELLSREAEIQQLEMTVTTANLRGKEAEAVRKQQKINLLEKERKLKVASLEKQTTLRNIFIGSSIAILLIAFIAIIALRARRRESEARAQAAEEEARRLAVERKQADYEARRSFTRQLIASQEQERKRIAADLHDSLAQELLIINNRVRLSARRDGLDETTANELAGISDAVSTSLKEIKNISKALRPFQLDRIGLTTTIESMLRSVNESFETEFECDVIQMEGWFTKEQEINIYRTVQEAVNNILKHASARHASVRIGRRNGDLHIEIHDDGAGFDAAALASPGTVPTGFGLQGMYERVDILDGNLNIRSVQGEGTKIDIFIPVVGTPESTTVESPLEVHEGGVSHV